MPYQIRGKNVYKKDTGELVGKARSHEYAKRMVRAIYASKAKKGKKR